MVFDFHEDALPAQLNELYWHSGQSIEEIVRSAGVTRNRLYTSVKPLSSGVECGSCGGDLQFVNRRSRLAGVAVCSACGSEASVDVGHPPDVATSEIVASSEIAAISDAASAYDDVSPDIRAPNGAGRGRWRTERAALLGGAAALG